ncbi:MAG: sensor histidine kinase [Planctomycetota bacterium]|jgi:signal transduction histidine kinase
MHKRLIILSAIIVAALCGLTVLGYHAIDKWAEGLQWKREGEFAEVAEQIRQDVKAKLADFWKQEEARPPAHYQYWSALEGGANNQELLWQRSPLAGRVDNEFAFGNFQINADESITTVNDWILANEGASIRNSTIYAQAQLNRDNVRNNLLPVLLADSEGTVQETEYKKAAAPKEPSDAAEGKSKEQAGKGQKQQYRGRPRKTFRIEIQDGDPRAQVMEQRRGTYYANTGSNVAGLAQNEDFADRAQQRIPSGQRPQSQGQGFAGQAEQSALEPMQQYKSADLYSEQQLPAADMPQTALQLRSINGVMADNRTDSELSTQAYLSERIQVKVGGFKPIVVDGGDTDKSVFGRQVFFVRDVEVENQRRRQGFQLNEEKLIEEVKQSAETFMREGMSFELLQTENGESVYAASDSEDVAYTADLDFVFGDFVFGNLTLNLEEAVPGRIGRQIGQLRTWYFSIVIIVLMAVTLGLVSLWRYARAQLKLAEKKDDFISAVSHEFRTPLTSIRMYSEMLEKNWVKSPDKLAEYYKSMRQESERLSRLIENVLDFSRIQKGRKKYAFSVGDLNHCVADVVEMMRPYAAQYGFSIRTEPAQLAQTAFDKDAVKQILVNLLDNAVKYARNAEDKTITVRTKGDSQFVLIEVEDHGPGVPHRQRKKIFEEFYRMGSEATRETTGTGLGLALVRKFAQAHNGFVEILTAKPAGAIFRVGLAMQS